MDHGYAHVALVPAIDGPMYIWRNVFGYHNRKGPENCTGNTDETPRGRAFKTGYKSGWGGARVYVYHNTMLHAPPPAGHTLPLAMEDGINTSASDGDADNMVTRNNIFYAIDDALQAGGGNDYDYDLYLGDIPDGAEPHGHEGVAVYDAGNGADEHFLAAGSPGLDAGVDLPGFNDLTAGEGPDLGAFERGAAPLEFGVNAYRTPATEPPPPPTGLGFD
jgi:hypothetical protein